MSFKFKNYLRQCKYCDEFFRGWGRGCRVCDKCQRKNILKMKKIRNKIGWHTKNWKLKI